VILTSHYMDDIAKLADHLLLISKGSIVYDGTVEGFMQNTEEIQTVTYRMEGETELHKVEVKKSELSALLKELTQRGTLENLKIEETDFEDVIHSFLQKESRLF